LQTAQSNSIKEVTPSLRTPRVDIADGSLVAVSADDRWGNFSRVAANAGRICLLSGNGAMHNFATRPKSVDLWWCRFTSPRSAPSNGLA